MQADPRLRGLYAITRGNYRSTDELLQETEAALRGGVTVLQYRDKSSDATQRLAQANALSLLCQRYDALLIINDDIELARACNAAGVHLGRDDSGPFDALERLGPNAIIGVSCYNQLEAARHAAASGASYVAFGAFFPSPTKPAAVRAETDLLEQWDNPHIPVCAIGGITLDNAAALVTAGADMTAVISDLWSAPDITRRARAFRDLWDFD
jgi:thiamine-phosphate pyrophosphorylase